jgi:uroporphyrinogen-III synthase
MTSEAGSGKAPGEASLHGFGVLVTRPAHQADNFCRLIEAAGGRAIRFPVMEIVAPEDSAAARAAIDGLAQFDIAIFISANAVQQMLALAGAGWQWPDALRVAAVGRRTGEELRRRGRPVDIVPEERFDSVGLLACAALREVRGKRIVIFRGNRGREVLADTLRARGAQIQYAEVYRRRRARQDPAALLRRWRAGEVDIVSVTSNSALRYLVEIVEDGGAELLRATPLAVISERQCQLAARLKFRYIPVVAPQASDQGMLEAIRQWRHAAAQQIDSESSQ